MSMELEEHEEAIGRLGSFVIIISSVILTIVSLMGSLILASIYIFDVDDVYIGYTFVFLFVVSLIIAVFSFLAFLRPWIKFKVNVFIVGVACLVLYNFLILGTPQATLNEKTISPYDSILLLNQVFTWIGIAGVVCIFISRRPNLGKESNKHIYQAYGAVIEFIVGFLFLCLGVYIIIFDISQFAGNGTFPGGFSDTYLEHHPTVVLAYRSIRLSGLIIIVGAIIIMVTSVIRNIISLKIASTILIGAIIVILIGISAFFTYWNELDAALYYHYKKEYAGNLALQDPVVVDIGIVLVMYLFIGLFMIIYSSTQAEPLEKWKTRRNTSLAAAEVAIRDGKLPKAVKYLEDASIWSSKLGEEDKSVELITRINSIRDKAIKMKKSEAAEKKKKELDAAMKKAADKKAPVKEEPEEEEVKEKEVKEKTPASDVKKAPKA